MQTYTFYTPAFSKSFEADSDRDALAEALQPARHGEDGTVIRTVAVVLY